MQLVIAMFLQRDKNYKNLKLFFCFEGCGGGGGLVFADLLFSRGNLEPNPLEKRGMRVGHCLIGWLVRIWWYSLFFLRVTACILFHFIISGRSRGLCLRRVTQYTK